MMIDATFWVAISFLIFVGVIIYFKVPQKIDGSLNESIKKIKESLDDAEKLKDEAKNILSEYDSKVSKSKEEIKNLITSAKNQAEKNIIKTNEDFHKVIENRKKSAEEKIKQMKIRAIKDVKNSSVDIAISSLEKIIKNSIDKKKLDKVYISSVEEAKKILKNKSI
ncbi:MAG: ATPase [Candidatus Marinimicrobia bacterium]|nr:ATPase [Candidatus Neomarinimicrobiota bacterium]RPG05396.1 MAG: ATPase [Pelagibacteraceae bacterium TMED247]|tara:strand:+ start:14528 stop:15025 length:498 start_codon:yes stop_codon:yes gene_type:complete